MAKTQLGRIIILTVQPKKVRFSPDGVRIERLLPTPETQTASQLGKIIILSVQVKLDFKIHTFCQSV